jgi:hypothetical protein
MHRMFSILFVMHALESPRKLPLDSAYQTGQCKNQGFSSLRPPLISSSSDFALSGVDHGVLTRPGDRSIGTREYEAGDVGVDCLDRRTALDFRTGRNLLAAEERDQFFWRLIGARAS